MLLVKEKVTAIEIAGFILRESRLAEALFLSPPVFQRACPSRRSQRTLGRPEADRRRAVAKVEDFFSGAGKNPNVQQVSGVRNLAPMGIISAIFIGLIVGAIAKLLMPGKDPSGWIITILIGMAGSFIGTYLGQAVGLYRAGEPAGFIGSIVGAMILLLIYRLVVKRRA